MSHSGIVSNIAQFKADVTAATGAGKEYVLGETNSGSSPFSHHKVQHSNR